MASRDHLEIDWESLRRSATGAAANAYAPYSRLRVGAAGLIADGTVLTGCNVENASYGLSLCAECTLVGAVRAAGYHGLTAVSCVDSAGTILTPCGRCRQVLLENGGPRLWVDHPQRPHRLAELLPDAFNREALP